MDNWITGLLALGVLGAFLIGLAISIGAAPFILIVAFVLLLAAADFFQSTRKNGNGSKS
jgi:hypothetical protein